MNKLISSIKKILWIVMAAVVICLCALIAGSNIGRMIFASFKSSVQSVAQGTVKKRSVVVEKRYELDQATLAALRKAKAEAETYADRELDAWIAEVMERVDGGFLDDYFSFANVKARELKTMGSTVLRGKAETEKALTKELEEKISVEVLNPEVSQKKIQNIMDGTINTYLETLDIELGQIQQTYNVPTPDWNEYISALCGITTKVKNKTFPVSIKATVMTGTAVTGTVMILAAKPIINLVIRLTQKAAVSSLAGSVALAAGGKAASVVPIVGGVILMGTIVWDIADYYKSAKKGKELLRQNIQDYLTGVKEELLGGTQGSLMGSITEWENGIKAKIDARTE